MHKRKAKYGERSAPQEALFVVDYVQKCNCTNYEVPTGNLDSKTSQDVLGLIRMSGLDEEGLREMAQDERTSYVLGMKMGQSVEIDGNIVQPAAFTASPLKAEGTKIETAIPTEGKMPAAFNEVMISDSYCDQAGLAVKPGDTVTFTWLDKTAESYVVSGLFHVDGPQPLYAVYV